MQTLNKLVRAWKCFFSLPELNNFLFEHPEHHALNREAIAELMQQKHLTMENQNRYILEITKAASDKYELSKTASNFSDKEALEVLELLVHDLRTKAKGITDPDQLNEKDFTIRPSKAKAPKLDQAKILEQYKAWVHEVADNLPDKTHFTIEETVAKICELVSQ